MNGLFLHTGNRLELLADELAGVTAGPLASPFSREVILVQSLGMSRWLSLQLAARRGVCMATEFPFPRAFLDETLRRFVPEMAASDAFAPDAMAWNIYELLPGLLSRPEFAPVRGYVADGDALKRFQLSERLAGVFDQYLVYRPELLLEWEAGAAPEGDLFAPAGDAAWQAALWRELNRGRALHFGAVLERLRRGRVEPGAEFPERVSIFGIASLPPAQVEVFFWLAAHCPVHLFLLAPSSEYHGDDLTPRQRARLGLVEEPGEGHPLLTSLGRLNAQFTNVLLEADERAGHRLEYRPERFEEPLGDSVLHHLQRDILHARARGEPGGEPPLEAAPEDRSVEVHVCHSPMREVEALYDRLLDLLAADPTLRPRDILVMTPDIESYAPLIHAVFGGPENPAWRIPYSIADRQPRNESPAIRFFLALLGAVGTRFTAPEGFALLQSPVMRARFGFDDAELARLRQWIAESGIRWGIDADERSELGLPATPEATWRRGLERLLLGYAMPGDRRTLFEGILPEEDVESSDAGLLGRFVTAMEDLFRTFSELTRARPLPEWCEVLDGIIGRFFTGLPDEAQLDDVRALREAVARLREIAGAVSGTVEFALIREHLGEQMEQAAQRGGFLAGGVTFCALKPMRSIPARVVWLMGMDESAFPRRNQPFPFDLIGAHPRPGDRSPRDDDRYLFLEAILSARDRLRVSYVGRSLVSRDEFPPSVVVSEFLDALEAGFCFPGGCSARQALSYEHRLHGFSADYFEPGGRLFSYSSANAAAASARPAPAAPFFTRPLPEPDAEWRTVALADLIRFFHNPAAYLLKRRLGVALDLPDEPLEESEPVTPDALGLYTVANEIFEARFAAEPPPGEAALAARALLPSGSVGTQYYRDRDRAARELRERLLPLLPGARRDDPVTLDLRIGEFALTGRLESVYGGTLAFFRPAKLKARDWLRAWISHLAWCAAAGRLAPTVLAGDDEAVRFATAPEGALARLLELYWRGLCAPLPFFPKASIEFAKPPGGRSTRTPLERATAVWLGNMREVGEAEDPAVRLCHGDTDPLGEEFETVALAVCGPMLEAAQ
ncbi:MAG: exodeoxyribonuclease V subunit gamma [Chthoniobacteraceae bacterium]